MDVKWIRDLFICDCENTEHQLIFSYDPCDEDDGDVMVYCSVHLKPERSMLKRLWRAAKYVVGHRSQYGDFDEFIFNPHDAEKLQKVVDHLRLSNREWLERYKKI